MKHSNHNLHINSPVAPNPGPRRAWEACNSEPQTSALFSLTVTHGPRRRGDGHAVHGVGDRSAVVDPEAAPIFVFGCSKARKDVGEVDEECERPGTENVECEKPGHSVLVQTFFFVGIVCTNYSA